MSKVILGGGLSGLSAAYYLLKSIPGRQITMIEASHKTGGWIKSNPTNGIIFEQGPRTIRPKGEAGENTLQLIEALNIADEIVPILSTSPAAQNRMIYAKGELNLVPSSLSGLFFKRKPFSKPLIFHLLKDLRAPRKVGDDEAMYDFIERRFGEEFADYLISPLICGICAGNAKEISVKFLMKEFFEYEQQYGSIIKGLFKNLKKPNKRIEMGLPQKARLENWNVYSFINGCETLPIALRSNIVNSGVNINLNSNCREIVTGEKDVTVVLNDNSRITSDHVVSAIPAFALSKLIARQHPKLADLLGQIKNVSVGVVNLHYDKNLLENEAFGFLVAPSEKLPVLGVIYDSCCFSWGQGTVLTVMMGGFWFEKYFGKNPSEKLLLETAMTQLRNILNIDETPTQFKVNILQQCIPQYVVGHYERVQQINSYISDNKLPISLCGNSYYGVGVNDVILSARKAVDQLNV